MGFDTAVASCIHGLLSANIQCGHTGTFLRICQRNIEMGCNQRDKAAKGEFLKMSFKERKLKKELRKIEEQKSQHHPWHLDG